MCPEKMELDDLRDGLKVCSNLLELLNKDESKIFKRICCDLMESALEQLLNTLDGLRTTMKLDSLM